jgi:hypothetical protein
MHVDGMDLLRELQTETERVACGPHLCRI